MVLTIVMICIVVSMVVGPIMMFKPSKSQMRVAKLRELAAKKGLAVRLIVSNSEQTITAYTLKWPSQFVQRHRDKVNWQLERHDFTHGVHFSEEWDWANKTNIAPQCVHDAVREALTHLPLGIDVVGANQSGLEVHWNERCKGRSPEQCITEVCKWLDELRKRYAEACEAA